MENYLREHNKWFFIVEQNIILINKIFPCFNIAQYTTLFITASQLRDYY